MRLRPSSFYHEHHSATSLVLLILSHPWTYELPLCSCCVMLCVPSYVDSISSLNRRWKRSVLEECTDKSWCSMMGSVSSLLIFFLPLTWLLPATGIEVLSPNSWDMAEQWGLTLPYSSLLQLRRGLFLCNMYTGNLSCDCLCYCFSAQFLIRLYGYQRGQDSRFWFHQSS